jgi:hypothetical protein
VQSRGLINNQPSAHFTWEEAKVTTHRTIENDIPIELVPAIKFTADKMEAIRALLSVSISILSWYRSPKLNTAVRGAKNSQHMEGTAVDFHAPQFGSPKLICQRMVKFSGLILFDQLILEHTWVHVSFNAIPGGKARKQVLTLKQDGSYAVGLTDKFGVSFG